MSSNNGWKPVAHCGEFALIVMSLERARLAFIPFCADAALVGELRPDDGPPLHVSYGSLEAMRSFIEQMQPRTLTVEVAPGEDSAALQDRLIGRRAMTH